MNGYFNNLAIRTVSHGNPGQGNMVQPRMASVFEPQGVIESTVESTANSLATDYTDQTNNKRAATSTPVRNAVAATEPSAPATEFSSSPENIIASVTDFSFAPVVSQEQPALPGYEPGPQPSDPETRVVPAAPVQTARVRPASPASVNEVLVRDDAIATTPTKKTIVQEPRFVEPEGEKTIDELQTERSIPPSVKSVKSVVHETETPRSTHHFTERLTQQTKQTKQIKQTTTTRREQLLLESAPDPEPSINITIGRVEVRATPTTAPKQKSTRTASPVMPLEEYLRKQRRGDER